MPDKNEERRSTRLIIVSGLSGSGKSVALNVLEDLGFYCIDNLPAGLLPSLLPEVTHAGGGVTERIGVGIDARNPATDLEALPTLVQEMKQGGIECDVIFLQAEDDILLKRYSETRRRHPMGDAGLALRDAIARERQLLGPVINSADLIIDTTRTSVYELRDAIRERVVTRKPQSLSILIESFGYKHGIPTDADFVFDLRCLPNPYWEAGLRPLTGLDAEVAAFLDAEPLVQRMFGDILEFLRRWIPEYETFHRSYLTIAVGCTGGQHRSVYMAEKLAAALADNHSPIHTRHNELPGTAAEGGP
ncbi:MAG: RNase adapter RapZ [Gammaproteobacteria bacterium]